MTKRPLVTVVDDDESVRESLPDLLKVLGYSVHAFSSAAAFLGSADIEKSDCLILDVAMPEMTGPELSVELRRRGYRIPVVFITAHRDYSVPPLVPGQDAVQCLLKPFSEAALIAALDTAIQRD